MTKRKEEKKKKVFLLLPPLQKNVNENQKTVGGAPYPREVKEKLHFGKTGGKKRGKVMNEK